MEITVKTLDSQTKTFNVSIETTVKEFKAKIADEMKIPIEKQRLIFQGKVLQDEKSLQEYKVNGCVVHLVERQPPRTTRSNGQSTETTTSSTPTTSSPGNMFMGTYALPVDVMGVTQQIVQGIIQQIGAESAQANISTSSSDDGSAVNVHINLSTVMARNDARSRIAPARVHLNNVSRILHRLQNDGMPSSRDLNEESSSSERQTGNTTENNNNETSLGDLADVLQQVVRLNDEIRPHLERYQELLRSGTERELRPVDDLLPDLAAEALHSLSHAYHALSDVTTNFRVPEPRLNVLPSMSPVPVSIARNTALSNNSQSQATTTSTTSAPAQSTGVNTGVPSGIPIGIGLRPGGATGIGLRTGRGLGPGFSLRPGFTLRPGNGLGSTFGIRNGLPTGIALVPGSGGLGTGSPAMTVPPTTTTTSTSGSGPRPQNPQQNPFAGLPINFRNLPNFAVQFNPASGNITIAHIVTTVVEEPSLRTTTTTTNSTPSPRTSSRGSNQEATPSPQGGGPPDHTTVPSSLNESPTPQDTNPAPQLDSPTSQNGTTPSQRDSPTPQGAPPGDSTPQDMDTSRPPPTSSAASTSLSRANDQSADRSAETNAVVNFMPPQNAGHRDPLLPCQSFHFASLVARPNGRSGIDHSGPRGAQRQEPGGQAGDRPSVISVLGAGGASESVDLSELFNASQQRAAAAALSGNTNRAERNPFLDLFMSAPSSQETISRDTAGEFMLHMTSEELPGDRAEGQGIFSRYLHRLLTTIPFSQLLMSAVTNTGDPVALTRTMTREFLRDDLLGGAEPTPENLQRATERILDELQETFQSAFAVCNVKENIDAPATLLTYLRPKIRRLLEVINSSESEVAYIYEVTPLVSRIFVELVALTEYCLQDGRTGMEDALRRSFGGASAFSAVDPTLRSMALDTIWASLANIRSHSAVRESTLLPFVVRKERRKPAAKEPGSASPKIERKEAKKEESPKPRASDTPRAVPSNTPSSSRRTRSSSQLEDTPMDTDENWKKVIPAEWVPVISQDIIRQQRMPRQAPFSDAYLNGMPPKRRKVQQGSEPAPYNQCVSATLKRSITKAGVTPKTDLEKMNEEANTSQSLERVFEDEVKSEVRKRLSTDTDYNSEKFPAIHKYFEKDEKR